MRDVAVDLLEAARDQRLGFLVSVKDPYAWGASVSAYYGWLPRGGPRAKPHLPLPAPVRRMLRPVERAVKCRQLWAGCLRSNRKHRAWLDLYERFPSQVTIVRYEDLLTESGKILCDIQRKYGLRQRGEQVSAIDQVLFPAWWDHSTRVLEERPFDASHYAERRYFEVLPPPMVDVITKAIDWPLMANFGYKRI